MVRSLLYGLQAGQQEVARYDRPRQRAAVAAENDQAAEVLELESFVERVAEPVRPVEERQNAQAEQDDTGEREARHGQQVRLTGRGHPARGEQQPEEQQ